MPSQFAFVSYDKLPDYMQDPARRYVERGELSERSFLRAVFEDRLVAAYSRADSTNVLEMRAWVSWLYNEAPAACWGSPETVDAWIEARRREHEAQGS